VDEELEALSLGWDDAAFKEKLLKTRATTPPAVYTGMGFPSLASPAANTTLGKLPATDPRPLKAPRPEREVPRRRLFPESAAAPGAAPQSEAPNLGKPPPLHPIKGKANGILSVAVPPATTTADMKVPDKPQQPSLASSIAPHDGFSMPPPEMGQVVSPQSDGMPRLFPDGMQQMPMANSPQYPAAMPQPQPQQMGAVGPLINGGGQGAFSPMALPPNTMLVPADDPSNPGQPLFRLMQLDQNGGPPGPQGPGMGMPNMPGMQQPQQPFYPPENGHMPHQPLPHMNNMNGINPMNGPMMPGMNGMDQAMYMTPQCNPNIPVPVIMCPKIYCLVEFKRGRTLQYESPNYVAPGEYVIVGGDRGEDLGMVVHTWVAPAQDGNRTNSPGGGGSTNGNSVQYDNFGNPLPTNDQPMGRVIRRSTPKEVQHLHSVQTELEKRCTEVCQQKVIEHGLVLVVVDAEYQFDRKKLTFYYDAAERQDFRDLVRDLYKTYRARIWMSKVNSNHR
jgi:hypothetical protein